jgi:hypothetical protein
MRHFPAVVMVASLHCAFTLEAVRAATPLGAGFTYQGQLKSGGSPANGPVDLVFRLFDAQTGGNPVGNPVTLIGVNVVNGLFTA